MEDQKNEMPIAENKGIFKKMALILKDIEPIKKEKTNTQGQGFKYRGIDDVLNALHDSFAKNEVFITTEVINRTETERISKSGGALFYVTSRIKFTFFTTDGSSVSSIVDGTAMDSGDKADNKCLSIALKYALLQAFLIPTEEMKDPDSETHEVKPKETKAPERKPERVYKEITEKEMNAIIDEISKGGKFKDGSEINIENCKKYWIISDKQQEQIELAISLHNYNV